MKLSTSMAFPLRTAAIGALFAAATLTGQNIGGDIGMGRSMGGMAGGPAGMVPSNINGFGLYSVSGFGGYSTYPTFDPASSRASNPRSGIAGAMAGMGYGKILGERSRFSLFYGPGALYRPMLNRTRMFHSLAMNLTHGMTERLSFTASLAGNYGEFDQFAFMPAQYSLVTAAPGSFDDLINAITGGQYSNSQIASLLTGTPVLESAARSSIYGNQALSANAQVGLNYRWSPRLSIGFRVGANRYQSVGISGDDLGRNAVLPLSNSQNAALVLNYAITPKTSIGATATISRTVSRIFSSSFITYTGNVNQRVGQRVFVTLSGGSGNVVGPSRVNYGNRYLANASVAFQATQSQTFMIQGARTFVDLYGLGLRSSQTYAAAWSYAPQGTKWSTSISVGYQEGFGVGNNRGFNGVFAGVGANRSLTPNLGLSGQFFYARSDNYLGPNFGISSQGVFERTGLRIVLSWFPKPLEY